MNAARVHGASAVFARISLRFGRRGQYGPCTALDVGMATDSGRDGCVSSSDIDEVSVSLSVSALEKIEGASRDVVVDVAADVDSENSDEAFRTSITF